jgi:hypothetical protein
MSPIEQTHVANGRHDESMWLTIVLIALAMVAISMKLRVTGGVHAEDLGSMSAQWLAEHRASERS